MSLIIDTQLAEKILQVDSLNEFYPNECERHDRVSQSAGSASGRELLAPTPMVYDLVAAAYRQERFNGGGQLTLGRTGAKPDDVLFCFW